MSKYSRSYGKTINNKPDNTEDAKPAIVNTKPSQPTPEPVRSERAPDVVEPNINRENPPQVKRVKAEEIRDSSNKVTRCGDFGIGIEEASK